MTVMDRSEMRVYHLRGSAMCEISQLTLNGPADVSCPECGIYVKEYYSIFHFASVCLKSLLSRRERSALTVRNIKIRENRRSS